MEKIPSPELAYTGTQVNYYFVCRRKLWLFSHNVEMERSSDLVLLGRLLHESSYPRKLIRGNTLESLKWRNFRRCIKMVDECKVSIKETEKSFPLNAKEFKTGSKGYHGFGKITTNDGKRYQVNILVVEIGSKKEV